jgi:hypothetical protein
MQGITGIILIVFELSNIDVIVNEFINIEYVAIKDIISLIK